MFDIINNLYNLALGLLAVFVILFVATVIYVVGIVKYSKKYMILAEELEKTKINNMINKENIIRNLKCSSINECRYIYFFVEVLIFTEIDNCSIYQKYGL